MAEPPTPYEWSRVLKKKKPTPSSLEWSKVYISRPSALTSLLETIVLFMIVYDDDDG